MSPDPTLRGRPTILQTISSWDGTSRLLLPGEPPPASPALRFAPGARDGVLVHHGARTDVPTLSSFADLVVDALGRLAADNDPASFAELYRLVKNQSVVQHENAILERLARRSTLSPDYVRWFARILVKIAKHREPLKLGILLLGARGTADDVPNLRLLARYEEFTSLAMTAVGSLLPDPTDEWWEMAKHVHGWGKIDLVRRLVERAADRPDLRAWLLRHGCANTIEPVYLAVSCAVGGDLRGALEGIVDDELLDGACVIVESLCGFSSAVA